MSQQRKSSRDTSSKLHKAKDATVSDPLMAISEEKWREINESRNRDLFIFKLRDEIVNAALDECQKRAVERDSIKFLVDCAHDAWLKIIALAFFYHDSVTFEVGDKMWEPDEEPQASLPDSWFGSLQVATKPDEFLKPPSDPKEETNKVSGSRSIPDPEISSIGFIEFDQFFGMKQEVLQVIKEEHQEVKEDMQDYYDTKTATPEVQHTQSDWAIIGSVLGFDYKKSETKFEVPKAPSKTFNTRPTETKMVGDKASLHGYDKLSRASFSSRMLSQRSSKARAELLPAQKLKIEELPALRGVTEVGEHLLKSPVNESKRKT